MQESPADRYGHVTDPPGRKPRSFHPASAVTSGLRRLPWPSLRGRSGDRRPRQPAEHWVRLLWRAALALLIVAAAFALGGYSATHAGARRVVAAQTRAAAVDTHQPEAGVASQFGIAYLTFDSTKPDAWTAGMSKYLASGVDLGDSWDHKGKQSVTSHQVAKIEAKQGGVVVVTVALLTDSGTWRTLAVPVIKDSAGGMAVIGRPAFVADPQRASYQGDLLPSQDTDLMVQLTPDLKAFFKAYAGGTSNELSYYAAPGAHLAGLNKTVELPDDGLTSISIEQGGDRRQAVVSVRWIDKASGAGLVQTYRLTLVQVGGKWLVESVAPKDR